MNRQHLVFSISFALLGINLMLIALIIGAKSIPIEQSIPSHAQTPHLPTRTEYRMERMGEHRSKAETEEGNGYWTIEHYQEFEYRYDHRGRLLEKRPTNHMEHIRYWESIN